MLLANNRLINYFKDARVELKKVAWPKKQEVYHHTIIVVGVSLVTAAVLGIFDYVFIKILERVL